MLDEDGLRARAFSSSYTPKPGDPRHEAMQEALDALFAAHQREGTVTMRYRTDVFMGPMRGPEGPINVRRDLT